MNRVMRAGQRKSFQQRLCRTIPHMEFTPLTITRGRSRENPVTDTRREERVPLSHKRDFTHPVSQFLWSFKTRRLQSDHVAIIPRVHRIHAHVRSRRFAFPRISFVNSGLIKNSNEILSTR